MSLFSFHLLSCCLQWLRIDADLSRYSAGLDDVLARQLRVALRDPDVGMLEEFGKLIQIAATNHVPGSERMAEIVKAEVINLCSRQEIRKALVRALQAAGGFRLGRQDQIPEETPTTTELGD